METLWLNRAIRYSLLEPSGRLGVYIGTNRPVLLPCTGSGAYRVHMSVYGTNVPADGNCLYYSVWTGAESAGISMPFGLSRSHHVFFLRVITAKKVFDLYQTGELENIENVNVDTVCDLIATPNQYLRYSGIEPIMAMALYLKRTIVVLCCDGIKSVVPFDDALVDGGYHHPIVIYHCSAEDITSSTLPKNHYVRVSFGSSRDKEEFKQLIEAYRGKAPITVDIASEHPHSANKRNNLELEMEYRLKKKKLNPYQHDEQKIVFLEQEILEKIMITEEEMDIVRQNQNFTKYPRLGLFYFHCCSCDPRTYVANNENLLGDNGKETISRLQKVLDKPLDANTIGSIQQQAVSHAASSGDIWVCASCCEIINTIFKDVVIMSIQNLDIHFLLTPDEIQKNCSIPIEILRKHCQCLEYCGNYYHLNPDLVPDIGQIVLCEKCAKNPKDSPYSIANGHDYGRTGDLPELNDVAMGCISPARQFGLEIVLSGKHSIGHSICFPSDGPEKCSRILPEVTDQSLPRITFVGPKDHWRIEQKKFQHLYNLPIENMYKWMRVLCKLHTFYLENDIVIDESDGKIQQLLDAEKRILENVTISDSEDSIEVNSQSVQERFREDYENDRSTIMVKGSAIIKETNGSVVVNEAVEAMGNMLDNIPRRGSEIDVPVVTVERSENPMCEWYENSNMIASTFPTLFMTGGKCLPSGSWKSSFIEHLMAYYDGRFESNIMFVTTLFNQLQRHAAIRKAAKVGSSRAIILKRLGEVANSVEFRKNLAAARAQPELPQSKKLNASLQKLLSIVGSSVPFSPFERISTRPKILALRYRYGVPLHWLTIAPPEHDDLQLHRIAKLRETKIWNNENIIYMHKECRMTDFEEDIQRNPRRRLSVSGKYPALSANVFKQKMAIVYNDILRCKCSRDTKLKHDFLQRPIGAYGTVAAHAGVIEPQQDGRLHKHMTVYGSKYSPELLTRLTCSKEMTSDVATWLDSICSLTISDDVQEWKRTFTERKEKFPRAYQIDVPLASVHFDDFVRACEKMISLTNVHEHSLTCTKGKRGIHMCRLARPAGIHDDATCPLFIERIKCGNMSQGIKPILRYQQIPSYLCAIIDEGYDLQNGKLFRDHTNGIVLWELCRSQSNSFTVETNLLLAATTMSHTNSAVITGEDPGDMIEEYQEAYMTKNDIALKGACSALLSAIEHLSQYPSRAEDATSTLRIGKYLATRTVNIFSGSHEWSHSLMVYAITGNRSFVSSDTFCYIYPYTFVEYFRAVDEINVENGDRISSIQATLDNLADMTTSLNNADEQDEQSSGTQMFSIDGKIVFLSQAESYLHRGVHFDNFSPLEFFSIIDILPVPADENVSKSNRGRPKRPSFPLAETHPLYPAFNGYIRAKMRTPIFGGPPPSDMVK